MRPGRAVVGLRGGRVRRVQRRRVPPRAARAARALQRARHLMSGHTDHIRDTS